MHRVHKNRAMHL